MPFNTTAAIQLFETRKYLQTGATICQLCYHVLEMSDDSIRWLMRQQRRFPFVNRDILSELLRCDREGRKPLVERFYQALGFGRNVTLESHSRPGSIVVDFNLDLARDVGFRETFDLVHNGGTTEHVFDQRAIFENIHNLCKVGGVMLHRIPMMGVLNINLYFVTPVFLYDLGLANGYELLDLRVGNRWGDTVKARLPHTTDDDDFRSSTPATPGYARGLNMEGPLADQIIPDAKLPAEMRLPRFLELADFLDKIPVHNLDKPMSRVCQALSERAKRFRPENTGELYVMATLRKTSEAPFRIPYQSKCLPDIEPREFRERYRNQFEALGIPIC